MADRGRIHPPPSKDAGGNWARESRRSAPSRIANPADYLQAAAVASASATDVRYRLPASRHAAARRSHQVHDDAARRPSGTERFRRAARRISGVRFGDDEAEESEAGDAATNDSFELSPTVARGETMEPFSRTETGDIGDGNDSDSSYNSFTLRLQKKSIFQIGENMGLAPTLTPGLSELARAASPTSTDEKNFSTTVYRVYRSYYRGNLFQEGNLTAQFRTGTNRKMFQHELSKPLFRWL
jgi:hypothetical protein